MAAAAMMGAAVAAAMPEEELEEPDPELEPELEPRVWLASVAEEDATPELAATELRMLFACWVALASLL